MRDIRTDKGKLIGKVEETTKTLCIKDGSKMIRIKIPAEGLLIALDIDKENAGSAFVLI